MSLPLRADAEMVVNNENKPLPLKDFAAPHLLRSEGTKPLPPGARRWVWAQLCLAGGERKGGGSAFVVLRIRGPHNSRSPRLVAHGRAAGATSVPRTPCPATSPPLFGSRKGWARDRNWGRAVPAPLPPPTPSPGVTFWSQELL